jgi:hypothetical protein
MRSLCVLVLLPVLACKGDPVTCEKGIRNYAQLIYWEQADAEIAAAPETQRDALRKEKLAKFEHDMERGLDIVVSKCTSADSEDQVKCMIAAKTAKQAHDCDKD